MDNLVDPQNLIREIYHGEIASKFFSLENYLLYSNHITYSILRGRIKGTATIMCQGGSYRTVVLLTHFYQRNTFVY